MLSSKKVLNQNLLSGAEWKRYFETGKPSRVMPTAYALKQGVYANETGTVAWWFRSPGTQETSPAYLNSWGDLGSRNHQVNETIIGVRPVMWVDKAVLKNNSNSSYQRNKINFM